MIAHRGKFFSYLRVSTDKQGERGNGLAAQQKAVHDYLNGGSWELLGEFVEIESGKRDDNRPQLAAALAACKKHRAKLVIAKLDRLSRDVEFIARMMNGKVRFVCCDMPEANELTLHIMAAMAQHERKMISERTKAGIAAAVALKGSRPGNRTNLREAQDKGNAAQIAQADQFARNVAAIIREIRAAGVTTLRGIAAALTARGVKTARGGQWTPTAVSNVLHRVEPAATLGTAAGTQRPSADTTDTTGNEREYLGSLFVHAPRVSQLARDAAAARAAGKDERTVRGLIKRARSALTAAGMSHNDAVRATLDATSTEETPQ